MKTSIKSVIVFTLICLVVSGILAGINFFTGPIIKEYESRVAYEACYKVMPDASTFEEVHVDKEIISEILAADLIVFSMGSLYTSIIPNLLSSDIVNAIDKSKAKILYICNAVNQPPETTDYTVGDYVFAINSYLGDRKIDSVFAAKSKLPKDIVDKYVLDENKKLVRIDKRRLKELNCELIEKDLLVIEDNYIRHDGLKLATNIFYYLMR